MDLVTYFAAMWMSEIWYGRYERTGCLYARARGIVLHDRILTGRVAMQPTKDKEG